MAINSDSEAEVDRLVEAGSYQEAAELARARGRFARAAELFERIWDFARAADCAEEAGDAAGALRYSLEARDRDRAARLVERLQESGDDGKRAALEILVRARNHAMAAPIAEKLGDLERAATLYRDAHLEFDAARILSALGRDNEAGRLLEKITRNSDVADEVGRAHLALGTILATRLRHDDAVQHLQEAAAHPSLAVEARRLLVVELAALGLRDAARDVLVVAREADPDLPADVDEVVRTYRPSGPAKGNAGDVEIIAGRYRLGPLLGAGGAGRVYRATDEVGDRSVAIKLYSTAHPRGHEGFERFVREARIASALRHPNLVEAYDFSAEHGYMVMEYMTGGSLAGRMPPRLRQSAVKRMALDLLEGLELAHRRGIIHRDIKPANVFFDGRGTAKLGDFGVAHLLDLGQTQTGGLIGTIAYMSPEQITGAPLTIAADLYALGVTLFEALTSRLPFLGPDFVAEHLGAAPPAPSSIDPDLAAWDPILLALLEKSPTERTESVDLVRRAIAAIDLEGDAHRPLRLPRARASGRRPAVTEPPPVDEDTPPLPERERYDYETPIGATSISSLSRAVDMALSRSVIIERYHPGMVSETTEARLLALARGGGPFLQRVLAYDREEQVVVYEAPSGSPLADTLTATPPPPRTLCRLLKRLARGLAPLHQSGQGHGALANATVLIDDLGFPTILVSGLGPTAAAVDPSSDIGDLVALLAEALGAEASIAGLIACLGRGLPARQLESIIETARVTTADDLYRVAEDLEVAILQS